MLSKKYTAIPSRNGNGYELVVFGTTKSLGTYPASKIDRVIKDLHLRDKNNQLKNLLKIEASLEANYSSFWMIPDEDIELWKSKIHEYDQDKKFIEDLSEYYDKSVFRCKRVCEKQIPDLNILIQTAQGDLFYK